jgi:hypothetical protein
MGSNYFKKPPAPVVPAQHRVIKQGDPGAGAPKPGFKGQGTLATGSTLSGKQTQPATKPVHVPPAQMPKPKQPKAPSLPVTGE